MNHPKPTTSTQAANPVIAQLTHLVSETYVLGVKTHGAHWNVRGANFISLHAAFDAQYHELLAAADEIAERIRALGGNAPGSMRQLLENSTISEPPAGDHQQLVRSLRDDHHALTKICHAAIAVAKTADDEVTVDILVQRSKAHEKTAWMLTAVLGE